MQHIENDMDDLFKRAGDNYPLNTSGSNWESVSAALYEGGTPLPVKKTNYRRFLWLFLLLIPVAWMIFNYSKPSHHSETNLNTNTEEKSIAGTIKQMPAPDYTPVEKNNPSNNNNDNNNTGVETISDAVAKEKLVTSRGPAINDAVTPSQLHNYPNNFSTRKLLNREKNTARIIDLNNTGAHQNIFKSNKNLTSENISNTVKELQYSNLNNLLAPLYGGYSIANIKKDLAQPNPNMQNAVSTNKKQQAKSNKESKFYAGLVVGPDISYIRSQKVKDAGYSVGINIGYRLNKHFAIEIGALYDQKKYYTNGEYFDKTGAGVPPYVTIGWLNGGCNMFEFPLDVRYNFNIRKNSFFVSGGFTSYVMKNESYQYSAETNGSWYEAHRSYDNSGNHLFSNMQWSLGYNLRLSSTTQLRFEPYIKVPVKYIGIGKMPITSSGIYFGITRDLK